MDRFKLRCRRCRYVLLVSDNIINTHGQPVKESSCSSSSTLSVWYISMENEELSWIREAINQALWIKGKLNCPKCNGRLGSFDFVNTTHCPCGEQTLPGVHILRDRVDKMLLKQAAQQQHFSSRMARSNSRLIKGTSIDLKLTSCQESTEGSRSVVGASQNQGTLPRGCDPVGWLDESGDDTQGLVSRTGGLVCGEDEADQPPRWDVITANAADEHPSFTPSAVEIDRLFSLDVGVNSDWMCEGFGDSLHKQSVINPACASLKQINVSQTVVRHGCDHVHRTTKQGIGVGDRSSSVSQTTLCQGGSENGCSVQPCQTKKMLRSRRRGAQFVDDDKRESFVMGTLNRLQQLEEEQTSSDDSVLGEDILEEHTCPVCLDMFLHPHACLPCHHVFCETCLRQLAQKSNNSTTFPCPMCRILIKSCCLDIDLNATIKLNYPVSYKYRRTTESKYLSHRYPLPRSIGTAHPHTINQRIAYAFGGHENIYGVMSRLWLKCFTFLGAVILVLLVLCVSFAL
ncbi:uncharacterized protein LOC124150294 isoform X1 [Haliotis rufescens]|uniref:uncharacterized protein LOC124150294 isoform X1 n=2 Tax=Haliotis rufescens TaxID=6454 RepID=UPI00201EB5F9|nr:uncharacterized protein LOC124150294 isoform X1 [Haliotis rufescens]